MPQGTYTNQGFSGTQEDETVLSSAGETKIQVAQVVSDYFRGDLLSFSSAEEEQAPGQPSSHVLLVKSYSKGA